MYIPRLFELKDKSEVIGYMQTYSFATLVGMDKDIPVATHLPFIVKENEKGDIILSSHLANLNTQSAFDCDATQLVIFAEPHAYISPKHYEKELNVPTWNYVAVHAYGKATVIDNVDDKLLALEEMISSYDKAYLDQWSRLPLDYKLKNLKGITVFKIVVTDLQGKQKLSQNRTATENTVL